MKGREDCGKEIPGANAGAPGNDARIEEYAFIGSAKLWLFLCILSTAAVAIAKWGKAAYALECLSQFVGVYDGAIPLKVLGFLKLNLEADMQLALDKANLIYTLVILLLFLLVYMYYWLGASFKRKPFVCLIAIDALLIVTLAVNGFDWHFFAICAPPLAAWHFIKDSLKFMR